MAEEQLGAAPLQRFEAVERRQHLLAVVDEARQAAFALGVHVNYAETVSSRSGWLQLLVVQML
jgi:hypothetical protein